jgi:transcriptional regulator with XRE-family HTH domain
MVARRLIRSRLRRNRVAAGLRQEDVANEMGWSLSKMMRIESGSSSISISDLRALLQFYKVVDGPEVQELAELAGLARVRSSRWTRQYPDDPMTPEFETYLAYEAYASEIMVFDPQRIPSLLRTRDYSFAVARASASWVDRSELCERRQQRLATKQRATVQRFVIDEAAITRQVGSETAMRGQLEHLQQVTQQPHIQIYIIPFSAGAYISPERPFTILKFAQDDDLLALGGGGPYILSEWPEQVSSYRKILSTMMTDAASSPQESKLFIEEKLTSLRTVVRREPPQNRPRSGRARLPN